jgi:hypothetical protein
VVEGGEDINGTTRFLAVFLKTKSLVATNLMLRSAYFPGSAKTNSEYDDFVH